MPTENDSGSTALFYVDKNGRKRDDGLHQMEPGDKHGYAEMNMQREMAHGLSRESAFAGYGPDGCTLAEHDAEMKRRAEKR